MTNPFTKFLSFERQSCNAAARRLLIPQSDIDGFVLGCMVKQNTVKRWFRNSAATGNIIKSDTVNNYPAFYSGKHSGDVERMFSGMLIESGLYCDRLNDIGEVSNGKTGTVKEFFETIYACGDYVRQVVTIKEGYENLGNLWNLITLSIEDGRYCVSIDYVGIGDFEDSGKLSERTKIRKDFIESQGDAEDENGDEMFL